MLVQEKIKYMWIIRLLDGNYDIFVFLFSIDKKKQRQKYVTHFKNVLLRFFIIVSYDHV